MCDRLGSRKRLQLIELERILWGFILLIMLVYLVAFPAPALAQDGPTPTPAAPGEEAPMEAPDRVEVEPEARDEEIRERLQSILEATGWFVNPDVRVQEGVVFLQGESESQDFKTWAGDLARRTQDVVAVVNQIQVTEPAIWDFSPALAGLREQARDVIRAFPLIVLSLVVLAVTLGVAYVNAILFRKSLRRRNLNRLLVNVIVRGASLAVFLVGLYIVFQVAGLASVALTVMGGTGLLGLILGIAFQDITENFLASILLSVQNPFRSGDLVKIDDVVGFVQMLTTRTTILMTQDGNHVQIPNATVYKSKIHNYTSNPNRREDFVVGIGYEDSTALAQEVALKVLAEHPAVLADPEPWVLVEDLGTATVNLRIYFWLDGSKYSWQKVKSSIIRLVKRAFQGADISMPGETRELIFPEGVPIHRFEADGVQPATQPPRRPVAAPAEEPATISTDAEAGLRSEASEIEEQARYSRTPEEGDNLLEPSPDE